MKLSATHLVDPQLAYDDVVHGGGDLSPHVVVPAGVELQVNGTWGGGDEDKRIDEDLWKCHRRFCYRAAALEAIVGLFVFCLQPLRNISSHRFFLHYAQAIHSYSLAA